MPGGLKEFVAGQKSIEIIWEKKKTFRGLIYNSFVLGKKYSHIFFFSGLSLSFAIQFIFFMGVHSAYMYFYVSYACLVPSDTRR